jgi:hypothetical protein
MYFQVYQSIEPRAYLILVVQWCTYETVECELNCARISELFAIVLRRLRLHFDFSQLSATLALPSLLRQSPLC